MLKPGDPLPPLQVRTSRNPAYALDMLGGRYVVLTFVVSPRLPGVGAYLDALYTSGPLLDDRKACCFVVINNPDDERDATIHDRCPGIRVIWDTGLDLARRFGCVDEGPNGPERVRLLSVIIDPGQHIVRVLPFIDPVSHFAELAAALDALPAPEAASLGPPPLLIVPNVFEPELCRDFIAYADTEGFEDSGYMQTDPRTGKTMAVINHSLKRRADCAIEDGQLRLALQARVHDRVRPQIQRAFQMTISRMERYLIARYDADGGGWFGPHKDNTTLGTAHRRFAVSIALNDDYEGGGVRFPEYSPEVFRAPLGGAVVFSCSILHEAMPVLAGRRYCVLPFVYDEAAARQRLENAVHFEDEQLRQDVVKSVLAPANYFEKRRMPRGHAQVLPGVPACTAMV